jgi:hypothetical protein
MHGKEWVAFGVSHCVLLIRERHCKLARLWSFNICLHDQEVDKRSFEVLKTATKMVTELTYTSVKMVQDRMEEEEQLHFIPHQLHPHQRIK